MAWSSNNNSGGAAAAGRRRRPVVVAGPGQGKAGKTGPGQTKPRLGTTGKPAKPRYPARFPACLPANPARTWIVPMSPKMNLEKMVSG